MSLYRRASLLLTFILLGVVSPRCLADLPSISVIPDQVIPEGGHTPPISFTVISTNYSLKGSSSDTLLFPATNIVFGGTGSKRTVTVTAATNRLGQATITIEADGSSGGAVTTFLVTVNAQLHVQKVRGEAMLSWTATNTVLQTANQLGSGWGDTSGSSPYIAPHGGVQFFRLRQEE